MEVVDGKGKIRHKARVVKVRKEGVATVLTTEQLNEVIKIGDMEINCNERFVVRSGEMVKLTHKEFDLVEALVLEEGKAMCREELAKKAGIKDSDSNNIDVYISNIRRKLDYKREVKLIKTIKNLGYCLSAD